MSAEGKCGKSCCTWHTQKAELIGTDYTVVHLVKDETEPCTKSHVHQRSALCETYFECDECEECYPAAYDGAQKAQDCCSYWECSYCSMTYGRQHFAIWCCHSECGNCGEDGWPDTLEDHYCETEYCNDCDSSECECSEERSMGSSVAPPWAARLTIPKALKDAARQPGMSWQRTWGFEPRHHDPVRAAGEFYALEGIMVLAMGEGRDEHGVGPTSIAVLKAEAKAMQDAIVVEFAPVFKAYCNLAIGGELRHHNCMGGAILPSSRSRAWAGWAAIREAVGVEALADAAVLFREFRGGSYGGENWAMACDTLYAYETGKMSNKTFLDRMFTLQHNGGALLNKVSWDNSNPMGHDVYALQNRILPAHGESPNPDYSILLSVASNEVRELFSTMWKVARIKGVRPRIVSLPLYQWKSPDQGTLEAKIKSAVDYAEYYQNSAKQYQQYGDTPQTNPYYNDMMYYKNNVASYWAQAAELKMKLMVQGETKQPSEVQLVLDAWFKKYVQYKEAAAKKATCNCWMCVDGGDEESENACGCGGCSS